MRNAFVDKKYFVYGSEIVSSSYKNILGEEGLVLQ
jgi:hypothetical protein